MFLEALFATCLALPLPSGGEAHGTSPVHQERILLIGDSNFFGSLGHTLKQGFEAEGHIVELRGKSASGLARPEYFDWFAEARSLIARFKPTIIISMIGANDVQRIAWPALDDRVYFKDEAAWRRSYEGRVRQFMRLLSAEGRTVYYLSPTNRGWDIARRAVTKVREVQSRAARSLPRVHYIDMFPLSSDEQGQWLNRGRDAEGHEVIFRMPDRIHLTVPGGRHIGKKVLDALKRLRG